MNTRVATNNYAWQQPRLCWGTRTPSYCSPQCPTLGTAQRAQGALSPTKSFAPKGSVKEEPGKFCVQYFSSIL